MFSRSNQTTSPQSPARPTLRDAAPEWAAMADKWAELCQREEDTLSALRPLLAEINKGGGFPMLPPPPVSTPAPPSQSVAALLANVVQFPKSPPQQPQPTEIDEKR